MCFASAKWVGCLLISSMAVIQQVTWISLRVPKPRSKKFQARLVPFNGPSRLAPPPALAEVKPITGIANARRIAFPFTASFFKQLEPRLLLPDEGPNQFPRPGVGFRILDGDFVVNRIRVDQRQAF